jgi:ASCH domain
MKILTVRQPWAGLIAVGQKDVENRTWMPPLELIGSRIGIHAGRVDAPRDHPDYADHDLCHVRGLIIATVRLADVVDDCDSEWAIPGNCHWILDEPRIVAKPPSTRGYLGLWDWPRSD